MPDPARCASVRVHGPSQVYRRRRSAGPITLDRPRAAGQRDLRAAHRHVHPVGTFDSAIERLDHLVDLGWTWSRCCHQRVDGPRNWGYDGCSGTPTETTRAGGVQPVRDGCHHRGLGVLLDVVYNHLGRRAYLDRSAVLRRQQHLGPSLNLDGPGSDSVRRYVIENSLIGARLPCRRAAAGRGARAARRTAVPLLEELSVAVERCPRTSAAAVADRRVGPERPTAGHRARGRGYGLHAQWGRQSTTSCTPR